MENRCDAIYRERNRLVAFLTVIFGGSISYKDDPEWPIVYIYGPYGQMSWHIPVEDSVELFSHLKRDDDTEWDGHATFEKYRRLAKITRNDIPEHTP